MHLIEMNDRELASVLAGLRLLQYGEPIPTHWLDGIRSNDGQFEPLTVAEIDGLCERINLHSTHFYAGERINENERWTIDG